MFYCCFFCLLDWRIVVLYFLDFIGMFGSCWLLVGAVGGFVIVIAIGLMDFYVYGFVNSVVISFHLFLYVFTLRLLCFVLVLFVVCYTAVFCCLGFACLRVLFICCDLMTCLLCWVSVGSMDVVWLDLICLLGGWFGVC